MLLSLFLALTCVVVANAHSVTVKGFLICGRNGTLPVFIELMESDAFGDDRLSWLNTKVFKSFEIKGSEEERFGITPYLRVTHSCRGFEETLIIHLGHRKGDVIINVQEVILDSYEQLVQLRHRIRFIPNQGISAETASDLLKKQICISECFLDQVDFVEEERMTCEVKQ